MNKPKKVDSYKHLEVKQKEMELRTMVANKQTKVLSSKTKTTTNSSPEVKNLTVKQRVTGVINDLRSRVYNVTKKLKLHRKSVKKVTKNDKKLKRDEQKRAILGIGLLFVVVSIAYSSYVIFNGVSSTASRVMLVPQVIFASYTLIKAFSKIYK